LSLFFSEHGLALLGEAAPEAPRVCGPEALLWRQDFGEGDGDPGADPPFPEQPVETGSNMRGDVRTGTMMPETFRGNIRYNSWRELN